MEEAIVKSFNDYFEDVINEVKKTVVGQDEILRNILIAIVAGGNVLMEGSPGLGKTVIIKNFSKVLDLSFSRIQFTPDLMPVDITGTYIVNKKDDNLSFSFQKGPIFSSMVLADEINRATPKTQSAMLEAMQEKTVTVGNETYELPNPFFVLATQNPLEMEGTYSLPEAQLDRFMFKLNITLPKVEDIFRIVDVNFRDSKETNIRKILNKDELLEMKKASMKIPIASNIKERAVNIMINTHPDKTNIDIVKDYVKCGASIRGVQSIIGAAKVRALSEGRFNVAMEDIEYMSYLCLRHRIFLNFKAMADKIDCDDIISEILKKVK